MVYFQNQSDLPANGQNRSAIAPHALPLHFRCHGAVEAGSIALVIFLIWASLRNLCIWE
jgi:hypothetical protein